MTAGFGYCKRPFVGALALGLLVCTISAQGQEIRFMPVATDGSVVCMPGSGSCGVTEIKLSTGGATVVLFLELSGWDPGAHGADDDYWLGAFQGTVEHCGYAGGSDFIGCDAGQANTTAAVGCNLDPVGQPNNGFEGAFQALKVCEGPPYNGSNQHLLQTCTSNADCAVGDLCLDRLDFVYYLLDATCTVSTATIDYSWSCASTDCREDPQTGERFYAGTLEIQVPSCAKGTYTVNFVDDVNFTLFNSCPGPLIPGLVLLPAEITVETGQCCFGIGNQNEGCSDDQTASECDQQPGPRLPIDPNGVCGVDECCQCISDSQCDDGDACTTDTCTNCSCFHSDNYATGVVCCDPSDGSTEPIDDGFVCTDDKCDPGSGIVGHNPLTGDDCTRGDATDDGNDDGANYCDFTCGDDGRCAGTDFSTVDCPSGDIATDCPEFVECAGNVTECLPNTSGTCNGDFCCTTVCSDLVITVGDGPKPDRSCFLLGEKVDMTVTVATGSSTINGGQFLINYDNTCLDFQSVGACDGSVFDANPFKIVDEAAGTIFYVSLIEPFKRCADGSKCNKECEDGSECVLTVGRKTGDLACISFLKKDGCDECDVCFDSVNPQNTKLTDATGYAVDICTSGACSKPIGLAGTLTIDGPDGAAVNSDCGLPTAIVEWDHPSASDTCDGDTGVFCQGAYAHKVGEGSPSQGTIDDLVWAGGEFTQGKWFFVCDAENTCGNTAQHVWTVDVSDQNSLDVEVHLGQPIIAGALSRCICFELYADCYKDPAEECRVLDFGPPYNFKGHARDSLKVDKNNYLCVTAVDCLHTLRSSADIECVDNSWVATWKGDPTLGGNWLVPGNLDCHKDAGQGSPETIDVLDFGKFIVEISRNARYPNGNTTCETESPHGDINGDGLVDNIDFAIIQMNFLKASKNACCPDASAGQEIPITQVSMKELRAMGLGELIIADLNGDGFLDTGDMDLYQQGVNPASRKHRGVR